MSIHLATEKDFSYIIDLSKRHAEELGFIPRAAMFHHLQNQRVTVTRENGDDVGYFLTNRPAQRQVRIFQACVQKDARGLKHGLHLLSDLVTRSALNGCEFLSLHCRDGLESNGFWSACGFKVGRIFPGGKARGKIIFEWHLKLSDALGSGILPYAQHLLATLGTSSTKSLIEGASKTLQETPAGAGAWSEFLNKLDTRESNVTRRNATCRTPQDVATEALRCLELGARLR